MREKPFCPLFVGCEVVFLPYFYFVFQTIF
jgi:hypothetical protein